MSPLWVALLAACRWSVDPDDPVKDPDILPDTAAVDSDTDPTDSDPPDTDPQDTDLTGETATPPPPVLCQPSGKIRTVEDLDRVIQTGSQADMLDPVIRSPMDRMPGALVLIPFIRETWDVSSGFGREWVDVDIDELFSSGLPGSIVSSRLVDQNIGYIFKSYTINSDSDSELEIAIEYIDKSLLGYQVSVSVTELSDPNVNHDPYYVSNCETSADARMLAVGFYDSDSVQDFATIHTELRCAAYDGSLPFTQQTAPHTIGGYETGSRPYAINVRNIDNAITSQIYKVSYVSYDMNTDGFEDLISTSYDGSIYIKYGPHAIGTSSLDSFETLILGSETTKLDSLIYVVNDITGDLIPDIYVWSRNGGRHGRGSLSLLRGPVAFGSVNYADLVVSEWSMIDPHLRGIDGSDATIESAGDLNADGIDDIIVYLGSFPIWKHGMLSDTANETGDSSDTSPSYGDTDPPTGRDFPYGLSLIIPGGVYGRRDMDEGALRIVRTDRPLPVGDVNGDGHDDIFFGTTRYSSVPRAYGLLYGCDFPLP